MTADTPPESPSSLLERAAAKLEDDAAHTIAGPWWNAYHRVLAGRDGEDDVAHGATARTAGWIATMSPSVASPLVEWLRDSVESLHMENEQVTDSATDAAVKFARIVLGEPLEHEWGYPYDAHPGARECGRCGAHDDSQPCR